MLRTSIAIAALIASVGGTAAQGDAAMGETVFNERCAGCHSLSGESDTAPALDNLIGRPAASLEGVQYSDGMIEAGQAGVVWDVETLTKFITKPRTVVNGTRMAFTGLSKPEDVANVIAYLATFSSPPAR
jgi:cytochrome c2